MDTENIISTLTVEEKIHLVVGKGSMQTDSANGKIKPIYMADGPLGLRVNPKTMTQVPSSMNMATGIPEPVVEPTAMPSTANLASTWNRDLAYLFGSTLADDCIDNNVDLLLAPGVNIKRRPLCGRNFEYFSEDPFLTGALASEYVKGLQDKGIGACVKHYCANNSEYDRNAISSEVDERTLREIYLTAFEMTMKHKPWAVMCSYNPINGIYASENKYMLNDVLRNELGFDGMVISDWGATHDAVRAIKANMNLIMPAAPVRIEQLKKGLETGTLKEKDLDNSVEKIIELSQKTINDKKIKTSAKEIRHDNCVKIAKESFVLLKNEGNFLPLKGGKILVAGVRNELPPYGGGGSSCMTMKSRPAPLTACLMDILKDDAEISYNSQLGQDLGSPGVTSVRFTPTLFRNIYNSDITVLLVGMNRLLEYEGGDREVMRLPYCEEDLIINSAKANENLVVLVYAGCAIDMSAWIDKVRAVLLVGYGGEGVNEALAEVLTGKFSPCGKLAETFPLRIEDTPTGTNRNGNGYVDRYSEGVFVGYRWYDEYDKPVLFPFGYGLSYAKFVYSDIVVRKNGDMEYEASFNVTNISDVDAMEISQVYVRDVFSAVSRPQKELKGFSKNFIRAGQTQRITILLNYRSFAFYSPTLKRWHVENGEFEILVGSSSADLKLKAKIYVESADEQYTPPMQ